MFNLWSKYKISGRAMKLYLWIVSSRLYNSLKRGVSILVESHLIEVIHLEALRKLISCAKVTITSYPKSFYIAYGGVKGSRVNYGCGKEKLGRTWLTILLSNVYKLQLVFIPDHSFNPSFGYFSEDLSGYYT